MQRINTLDAIRFFCAFVVVLHHIDVFPALIDPGIYRQVFFGSNAVIAFFVISGFCIHIAYRDRTEIDWGAYFVRRYVRIIPAIVVISLIGAAAGVSYAPYGGWVTWSLICELIYYTAYPAILVASRRFGWRAVIATSFVAAYATYAVIGQIPSVDVSTYPAQIMRDTVVFAPGWLLGAALAEAWSARITPPTNNVWLVRSAVAALSILSATLHYKGILAHNWMVPALCAVAALWVWVELFYGKWPDWISKAGEWSYSLYLVHPAAFYGTVGLFAFVPTASAQWALAVGFILVSSYVFYRLVEKPSHELARSLARRRIAA